MNVFGDAAVIQGRDLVEKSMGARFGDPENPLLFSVRSGAPVSMPGMMNTILNLGLNDEITEGLAKKTGNARFAYDSYPYALLASGHVDAVVDFDLQPYDYHAVALLVEEAGGVMTGWRGERLSMQIGIATVAAATAELHAELLEITASGL